MSLLKKSLKQVIKIIQPVCFLLGSLAGLGQAPNIILKNWAPMMVPVVCLQFIDCQWCQKNCLVLTCLCKDDFMFVTVAPAAISSPSMGKTRWAWIIIMTFAFCHPHGTTTSILKTNRVLKIYMHERCSKVTAATSNLFCFHQHRIVLQIYEYILGCCCLLQGKAEASILDPYRPSLVCSWIYFATKACSQAGGSQ